MKTTTATIAFMVSASCLGYEPQQAQTNQAHELAECAVYYLIAAECAKNTNPEDSLAANLETAAGLASELSIKLSNPEVAKARVQMAEQELRTRIDNQCSNFSILINDYNLVCSQAVQKPDERLTYWLEKE